MNIINREYVKAMKTNSKLPFPYLVQLEITNVCPFNCPQCYKEATQNCHMNFYGISGSIAKILLILLPATQNFLLQR